MEKRYAILTVIYNTTEQSYKSAITSFSSMPEDVDKFAVINKAYKGTYPAGVQYIQNSENNLSLAWNTGLAKIFEKYDYAIVTGLDSICPIKSDLDKLVDKLASNKNYGVVSGMPLNAAALEGPIVHGDGAFSLFCVSKETFRNVGDFDVNFAPAYFEDNDYLERLWEKNYKPIKIEVIYPHVNQGTVKMNPEIAQQYSSFMNNNLYYFKTKWGKVPDHLSVDVRF